MQQHRQWCQSILQFFFQLLLYIRWVLFINIVLLVLSFMKSFKRKEHSSLLKHLKTHCKFPLIETFLETLTDSSKKVLYIVCGIIRCTLRVCTFLWGLVIYNHLHVLDQCTTSRKVQQICDKSGLLNCWCTMIEVISDPDHHNRTHPYLIVLASRENSYLF